MLQVIPSPTYPDQVGKIWYSEGLICVNDLFNPSGLFGIYALLLCSRCPMGKPDASEDKATTGEEKAPPKQQPGLKGRRQVIETSAP